MTIQEQIKRLKAQAKGLKRSHKYLSGDEWDALQRLYREIAQLQRSLATR